MRESGVVIAVDHGRALIEVTPAEGCGKQCSCHAVEGKSHLRRVELEAPEGLRPGDVVELEVRSSHVLLASAAVFLVPPALFVAGAAVSRPLLAALGVRIDPDFGMFLCGIVGFLLGLAGALLVSRRGVKRGWLRPHIVAVSNPAPSRG